MMIDGLLKLSQSYCILNQKILLTVLVISSSIHTTPLSLIGVSNVSKMQNGAFLLISYICHLLRQAIQCCPFIVKAIGLGSDCMLRHVCMSPERRHVRRSWERRRSDLLIMILKWNSSPIKYSELFCCFLLRCTEWVSDGKSDCDSW